MAVIIERIEDLSTRLTTTVDELIEYSENDYDRWFLHSHINDLSSNAMKLMGLVSKLHDNA